MSYPFDNPFAGDDGPPTDPYSQIDYSQGSYSQNDSSSSQNNYSQNDYSQNNYSQNGYSQNDASSQNGYLPQNGYSQNGENDNGGEYENNNDQRFLEGSSARVKNREKSIADTTVSTTAIYEHRRDSLAARLSQSREASQAAYESLPKHKSFSREDSPYSEIRISDPEKVDDYTSYKLVALSKDGGNCFTQQRRYQHFEWLYHQLVAKYPGVIVPPIPEKRVFGKFDVEFVELRRHFLEVFLRKLNRHPILMGSEDFRTFVHSNRPEELIKKEGKGKGIMTLVGGVFSDSVSFSKSGSDDKWYETKKEDVAKLDGQLRTLRKKVEAIIKQRKELGSTVASFWNEISLIKDETDVFDSLAQLGSIQLKVEEVHQRESAQYVLNFGCTVDLYVRMITSLKIAFNARATCHRVHGLAEENLRKKKEKLEKIMGQLDKNNMISQVVQEVDQAQGEVDAAKRNFNDIDEVTQAEAERFEREMREDFQDSMSDYVKKMVEAQEEVTRWWNDYLPQVQGN